MPFRILAIGDVVGAPGRAAVRHFVPRLRQEQQVDFVVVNGENVAGGAGITPEIAKGLFADGVDVITTGDHIWRRAEIVPYLCTETRLLRPANYAPGAAGSGCVIVQAASGVPVAVVNLQGRIFMDPIDSPFQAVERALAEIGDKARVILVDFHAEATSEKVAMGWFLDGRVTAVVGTHTHVQTADERVLPSGTACITDLGMTGPHRSVLGREVEPVVKHLLYQMRERFDVAKDDVWLSGVVIAADPESGKANAIERVHVPLLEPEATKVQGGSEGTP
jgi:hypothetical protein